MRSEFDQKVRQHHAVRRLGGNMTYGGLHETEEWTVRARTILAAKEKVHGRFLLKFQMEMLERLQDHRL